MKQLCHINDINDGQSKGFEIDGEFIFAVKKGQDIFVYKNACPHLGIQLEWQPDQFLDDQNQFIQCSMHGALFNIHNGECIFGPCQGDSLISLETTIIDDKLCIVDDT